MSARRFKRLVWTVNTALLLALVPCAGRGDEVARPASPAPPAPDGRPVLKLAGPDFPPYYGLENGRMSGHLATILRLIAETAGYATEGDVYPAARLMWMLTTGEAHASLLVRNDTLENAPEMIRTPDPVAVMSLNIYGTGERRGFAGPEDLRGRTIIVMRGYGYGTLRGWMERPENRVTLVEANSFAAAVGMLEGGRAPLALLYDVNYAAALKAMGRAPGGIWEAPFQRVPLHIYLNVDAAPGGRAVMERLIAAHHRLVGEGRLRAPDQRPEDVVGGPKS